MSNVNNNLWQEIKNMINNHTLLCKKSYNINQGGVYDDYRKKNQEYAWNS